MSENKIIRKVAILGAGVMGAQIAAQCINVGLPVVLFDSVSYTHLTLPTKRIV